MNGIKKSLVLSSLFPESLNSFKGFSAAVNHVKNRGFSIVEFYTPEGHDKEAARLLRESGLESVFIGVYPLKSAGHSLCATDQAERNAALAVLRSCIDRAAVIGAKRVMINSGFMPRRGDKFEAALACYVCSVNESYDYIHDQGYALEIELEPGDSAVQSFQLLGPTDSVAKAAQKIHAVNPGYGIVMDTAHIAEEGEDVLASIELAMPFCDHIHLCNCYLKDPAHPMYGDRHVDFDYPGAVFDYAGFEVLYNKIKELYSGRDLIISLEIMCRDNDNYKWFDRVVLKTEWLFNA